MEAERAAKSGKKGKAKKGKKGKKAKKGKEAKGKGKKKKDPTVCFVSVRLLCNNAYMIAYCGRAQAIRVQSCCGSVTPDSHKHVNAASSSIHCILYTLATGRSRYW